MIIGFVLEIVITFILNYFLLFSSFIFINDIDILQFIQTLFIFQILISIYSESFFLLFRVCSTFFVLIFLLYSFWSWGFMTFTWILFLYTRIRVWALYFSLVIKINKDIKVERECDWHFWRFLRILEGFRCAVSSFNKILVFCWLH